MNEEDKFEARHQEIVDAHTGATITLGSHAGGHRWLRIAVPHSVPDSTQEGGVKTETKTTTITFGPDGQALKITPHVQAATGYHASTGEEGAVPESEPPEQLDSPRAVEIKEELHHLDEIEANLNTCNEEDEEPKVDKPARKSKK